MKMKTGFLGLICLTLFAFISCENSTTIYTPVEPTYCTVIFDSNGGTKISSQKVEKGKTAVKPTNPIKEGYTFSNWYNGNSLFDFSTPINSDITLKASWSKNSTEEGNSDNDESGEENNTESGEISENKKVYTIIFNINDGSDNPITKTQSIEEGKASSLTTTVSLAFARAGYVFSEWNTAQNGSGTKYSDGAEITLNSNLTLFAQWTAGNGIHYTVKHYQQNITDDNYTLIENDTQILTGKTGSSTNANSKTYEGFTAQTFEQKDIAADGNTTIEIYYNRNIITLTFSANGGTWSDGTTADKTLKGKYGAVINIPDLPTLTDYKGKWDQEIQTTFSENKNYSVVWMEKTKAAYKVTYMLQTLDGNDYQGTQSDTFYGNVGEYTNAQPKEIEGFVLSPSYSLTQKIITEDGKTYVRIYYDRITVTLTFKANGGKWEDGTAYDIKLSGKYGAKVVYNKGTGQQTPLLLEKKGYETVFDKTVQTTFTNNETYTASYNPIIASYRVNHWQQNITDDNYTLFETETLSGIVGSKTQASIKSYTGFTMPTENPNYNKTVSKNDTVINIYYKRKIITLTFSTNGGTWSDGTNVNKTIKGKYEAPVPETSIPNPSREGYSFTSWDKIISSTLECDETYTACWAFLPEAQYTVCHWKQNIENDEYTLVQNDIQTLNGIVSFQTAAQSNVYEGFTARAIKQKKILEDGSTVVDIYYDRNIITLTFISYNSTQTQTGKYGEIVIAPVVTRSRYNFIGWNKDVQETYLNNETYTAQWEGYKYTVTFKANGGIGEDVTQEFTYGESQKFLKNTFTNDAGYCFLGWSKVQNSTEKDYSDEENYSATGNTILYAVWDSLAITSENIANVIANPESYVNGKTVIANPVLENGKKVDYRINMTGTISDETLEIIKTAIIQQKEKELCLDMKRTTGITVLKKYSFMDTVVSTGEHSTALKVLYIPDSITTIENSAILAVYLEDVYLSNSLVEIKPGAFHQAGELSFVYFMQMEGWYSYTDAAHTKDEKLIDVTKNDKGEFQNARCFKCKENYEPWGSLYLYFKGI